ncbi:hypothetical protein [Clostridium butyricum]|uniref:Uncharacterized protein n=1 Tax=Clostridium butyricum TaxID=1492 RepID=A0A6N3GUS8_CLOBU
MKIENLTEGLVLKNYKELCSVLDMPVRDGKSKKLQLQDLARFVELTKEGHKFIVKEIFDVPIEKEDKRKDAKKKGNNSKYSNDIQPLILDTLAKTELGELSLPLSRLLILLKIVNDNYYYGKANIPKLAEIMEMERAFCYDFYFTAHSNFKRKIESALNSLKRRCVIKYKENTYVSVRELDEDKNKTDDIGDWVITTDDSVNMVVERKFRIATKEEERQILKAEKYALKELGYTYITEIVSGYDWGRFNWFVKKYLERTSIAYYYTKYDIIWNREDVIEELESDANFKLSMKARKELQENLNKNIIEMLTSIADKKQLKAIKEQFESIDGTGGKDLYLNKDFLHNNQKLIDMLIVPTARKYKSTLQKPVKTKKKSTKKMVEINSLPF